MTDQIWPRPHVSGHLCRLNQIHHAGRNRTGTRGILYHKETSKKGNVGFQYNDGKYFCSQTAAAEFRGHFDGFFPPHEKIVFPEDIQCDNVAEGVCEPKGSSAGNTALQHVQECPRGRHSKPRLQRLSVDFLSVSMDQKRTFYSPGSSQHIPNYTS